MTHKRNTSGLAIAARKKRQDVIKNVDEALKMLVKQKKAVNFNSVAKAANVSKTWLYKNSDAREHIIRHRENKSEIKKIPITSREKTSLASKEALIRMLQDRIKEVENENRELKKQIEILYGQLCIEKGALSS